MKKESLPANKSDVSRFFFEDPTINPKRVETSNLQQGALEVVRRKPSFLKSQELEFEKEGKFPTFPLPFKKKQGGQISLFSSLPQKQNKNKNAIKLTIPEYPPKVPTSKTLSTLFILANKYRNFPSLGDTSIHGNPSFSFLSSAAVKTASWGMSEETR